ncbi:hypothetical protein Tco_0686244, partial [Tanacetum coccineum]
MNEKSIRPSNLPGFYSQVDNSGSTYDPLSVIIELLQLPIFPGFWAVYKHGSQWRYQKVAAAKRGLGLLIVSTFLFVVFSALVTFSDTPLNHVFGLMVYLKAIGSVKVEMTCILARQPVRVAAMAGLSSIMCVVAGILSHSYLKMANAFAVSVAEKGRGLGTYDMVNLGNYGLEETREWKTTILRSFERNSIPNPRKPTVLPNLSQCRMVVALMTQHPDSDVFEKYSRLCVQNVTPRFSAHTSQVADDMHNHPTFRMPKDSRRVGPSTLSQRNRTRENPHPRLPADEDAPCQRFWAVYKHGSQWRYQKVVAAKRGLGLLIVSTFLFVVFSALVTFSDTPLN